MDEKQEFLGFLEARIPTEEFRFWAFLGVAGPSKSRKPVM